MKNSLYLIMLPFLSFSQTLTTFKYDSKGNRTEILEQGSSPVPKVGATPKEVEPTMPVLLTATGCTGGTVSWHPVGVQGTSITVNPTITTVYTANCTVPNCVTNYNKVTVSVLNCPPTRNITITKNKSTIKYGDPVTLVASGCSVILDDEEIGKVVWSDGFVGERHTVNLYQSSKTYSATCTTPYCTNAGSESITLSASLNSNCPTLLLMYTVQNGDWNSPSTWSCNRVPTIEDEVLIRHTITVSSDGEAKKIIFGIGDLNFSPNTYIKVDN